MQLEGRHFYEFGPYRVDAVERRLLRGGAPVPLTPKAFETLLALVENAGRGLGKDELLQRVWPDTFVEEGSLTRNISVLRKVLGDENGEYIETVPKRGYRFVAPVREIPVPDQETVVDEHTLTRVVIEETETTTRLRLFPRIAVGILLVFLVVALAVLGLLYRRASVVAAARARIPEVERLFVAGDHFAAFDLLMEVERIVPDDPRLPKLRGDVVLGSSVQTDPAGAAVYFRDYREAVTPWRYLGKSPLAHIGIPFGPLRWKLEKSGRPPTYAAS